MREHATRRVGLHPRPGVATSWPPPLPMPADLLPPATVVGGLSLARSLESLLLSSSAVSCSGAEVKCHAIIDVLGAPARRVCTLCLAVLGIPSS